MFLCRQKRLKSDVVGGNVTFSLAEMRRRRRQQCDVVVGSLQCDVKYIQLVFICIFKNKSQNALLIFLHVLFEPNYVLNS